MLSLLSEKKKVKCFGFRFFSEKCTLNTFWFHFLKKKWNWKESDLRSRSEIFQSISKNGIFMRFFVHKIAKDMVWRNDFLSHTLTCLSKIQEYVWKRLCDRQGFFTFLSPDIGVEKKAFRELKIHLFHFSLEKWKWNRNGPRTKSESCKKNSWEFLRNEILAEKIKVCSCLCICCSDCVINDNTGPV